jgi:hypothetical protein
MSAAPDNGMPLAEPSQSQVSPEEADAPAFSEGPEPEFQILSVEPVPRSAAPTLRFTGRIDARTDRPVYAVALTALITVEPSKRSYDEGERERLAELFGSPERWASTTGAFRWAQVETMVAGFTGSGEFALDVPCTYDLELASGKYFGSLASGSAPLRVHFNGSVFYEAEGGRVQVVLIPWDRSIRFDLPIAVWQAMIAEHHPNRGWIPLATETVDRLRGRKARDGAPTFDACVSELLDRAEAEEG